MYVLDPVNGNDYSGLLGVITSSGYRIRVVVVNNYGMQPHAPVARPVANTIQATLPAARAQGPGATRSNMGTAALMSDVKGIKTYGINASLGVIGYGSLSIGIARGADGSTGLYATTGVGATTGFSSGLGPEYGRQTSGVGIASLRGTQAFGGASGSLGILGAGCDLSTDEYSRSAGIGLDWSIAMPMEGHVGVERTWVLQLW